MEEKYQTFLNGAPSMYIITKEIYEQKEQNKKLLKLYNWLTSYESLEIPQYEIKNKIRELLNE